MMIEILGHCVECKMWTMWNAMVGSDDDDDDDWMMIAVLGHSVECNIVTWQTVYGMQDRDLVHSAAADDDDFDGVMG
eukprot:scaffold20709_cov28-Tisochrysis_lutea.AAC.1